VIRNSFSSNAVEEVLGEVVTKMRPEAQKLKSHLDKWRGWMNDNDPHSITHQLYQMVME
jgi:hypothetical protein